MDLVEEQLRNSNTIAVVGLSDNPERISYGVSKYMQSQGYRIIPVNPMIQEALGEKAYPDLKSVPVPIDMVDVFRRSELVPPVVDEAIEVGVKYIWMQDGVINPEAAAKAEAAGIPQFVAKVSAELHVLFIEEHIGSHRRAAHRAKAQCIRAVLRDEFQRLGRVAEALGHFAALFVTNDSREINITERQFTFVFVPRHDHSGDPKENDVRPRDEIGGGIKFLERLRVIRPAHRRKRP